MVEIKIIPNTLQLLKMTDEEYFSDKYKKYISNSRLGYLDENEGGSEEKFIKGFDSSFSDSFELGSAIHAMLLQPDFYFIAKASKPTGKLGVFAEEVFKLRSENKNLKLSNAFQLASVKADYYSGQFSTARIKTAIKKSIKYYLDRIRIIEEIEGKCPLYLSSPNKEKLNQCLLSISSNEEFLDKLNPKGLFTKPDSFNEYAILCEVEVIIDGVSNIVKIKAKLDNFTIDRESQLIVLNDLKSSGKPVKFFMGNWVKEINENNESIKRWYNGSFQTYHYYRQMGLYLWLLQAALKQYYDLNYKLEANMLVIETIPNYKNQVFKLNNKHIQSGLAEFKSLLTKVVLCNLQNKI